jgi:serine/threonine protein kinase
MVPGGQRRSAPLFGPGYLVSSVLKAHPKGSVFLALDLRDQRAVALKVLKQGRQFCLSDDMRRDMRSRLQHQERLSNTLQGVVPTPAADGYFEVNGNGYLALDYVEGSTLLQAAGSMSGNQAWGSLRGSDRARLLSYLTGLATHLAALHKAGFVHRDVTPTNVIVGESGDIWLLDLELAHEIGDPQPPFGQGTIGYMSPEQQAGKEPSASDDAFSFGCLLTLILTGCDPHRVIAGGSRVIAGRLRKLSGGASDDLLELAMSCLSRFPQRRPTMTQITRTLIRCEDGSETEDQSRSKQVRARSRQRSLEDTIARGLQGLVRNTLRDSETGLWMSPSAETDRTTGAHRSFLLCRDVHHGVAGVVYALTRLAPLGFGHTKVVRSVIENAIRSLVRAQPPSPVLPGLFFGEAGVAVALLEAQRAGFSVTDDEIRMILLRSFEPPIDWLDITHGAAGQGIAAMLCGSVLPERAQVLRRCARHLIAAQERDGSWRIPPGVDGLSGQTLSGFAHGCAGIVYFLGACSDAIGVGEESWRRGAAWLIANAQANAAADSLEWAYSDSLAEQWKWWCHGAPGIALAFLRLFLKTGEGAFADVALKALRIHGRQPRATNLSTCHGLAGLGEIYLEAATILDDNRWRWKAEEIASTVTALAQCHPQGDLTWLVEDPFVSTADLMIGCGGVLHFLARVHDGGRNLTFPLLLSPNR